MLRIEKFTNRELVNAIAKWILESNAKYTNPESIASALEDDSWLKWYNDKLKEEKGYQDAI